MTNHSPLSGQVSLYRAPIRDRQLETGQSAMNYVGAQAKRRVECDAERQKIGYTCSLED
jgi:hypothetical protein